MLVTFFQILQTMGTQNLQDLKIFDTSVPAQGRKRSVYLEGGQAFYKTSAKPRITKVAPFYGSNDLVNVPKETGSILYQSLRPILTLSKIVGIFPIQKSGQKFLMSPVLFLYSVLILIIVVGYVFYIRWSKLEEVRTAEGRFEEAVIDYLFSVYLIPVVINILSWYEARKQARVLTKIVAFEGIYYRTTKKKYTSILGKKPVVLTIALPVLAISTMVITHVTMAQFKQFKPLQVILAKLY